MPDFIIHSHTFIDHTQISRSCGICSVLFCMHARNYVKAIESASNFPTTRSESREKVRIVSAVKANFTFSLFSHVPIEFCYQNQVCITTLHNSIPQTILFVSHLFIQKSMLPKPWQVFGFTTQKREALPYRQRTQAPTSTFLYLQLGSGGGSRN
jgi:hypothetical protein